LTNFPFTDLSSFKRRPALVISKVSSEKGDVIVAFISSVIPDKLSETDFVLNTEHKDFTGTGLKKNRFSKWINWPPLINRFSQENWGTYQMKFLYK